MSRLLVLSKLIGEKRLDQAWDYLRDVGGKVHICGGGRGFPA